MKKYITVALLLSSTVCFISSCEDQMEEFENEESQQIEHAEAPTIDKDEAEDGGDPE
mgnify:CR=1 FL=1